MNDDNLFSDQHLDPEYVNLIVSGRLPLEKELVCFSHWKECSECRKKLLQEMPATGFYLSSLFSGTVEICSVVSTDISFHFACVESGVLAASFTMMNLQKLIGRGFNINVELESSDLKKKTTSQVDKWLRVGSPLNRTPINTGLIGTAFMLQVLFWAWLIPFGQIVTYGDIARWMEKQGASRAVGQALHNNPIPVFIPCHRVVGKDGNLAGFSAGLDLKKQLLRIEGHRIY